MKALEFSSLIFPDSTAVTPYPEASNVTVGQGFYNIVAHLPKGTEVTWGVNLGTSNMTAAMLEAKAIFKAFSSPAVKQAGVTLKAVEIGNEPDVYTLTGHRNSSWNVVSYVQQ